MAIVDLTQGGTTGVYESATRKQVVFRREIDFSVAANNLQIADIGKIIAVPADFLVQQVFCKVVTVEGIAGTITVGDETTPAGWILTVDMNALGWTMTSNLLLEAAPPTWSDVYMGTGGKVYTATDTIDVVPDILLDAAKIQLFVAGLNLNILG